MALTDHVVVFEGSYTVIMLIEDGVEIGRDCNIVSYSDPDFYFNVARAVRESLAVGCYDALLK